MDKNNSVEFLCYYNLIERISAKIIKSEIYYDLISMRYFFYINSKLVPNNELRLNFLPHEDRDNIYNAKKQLLRNKKLEQLLK